MSELDVIKDLGVQEVFACAVKSGTRYSDEPSVEVDPGWYVLADNREADERRLVVKVEAAWNSLGDDIRARIAYRIAELLQSEVSR